jgi:hypothetical protein
VTLGAAACSSEAGTSAVMGPLRAFATAQALCDPVASITIERAARMVATPIVQLSGTVPSRK